MLCARVFGQQNQVEIEQSPGIGFCRYETKSIRVYCETEPRRIPLGFRIWDYEGNLPLPGEIVWSLPAMKKYGITPINIKMGNATKKKRRILVGTAIGFR